jgi:hypothetical protein
MALPHLRCTRFPINEIRHSGRPIEESKWMLAKEYELQCKWQPILAGNTVERFVLSSEFVLFIRPIVDGPEEPEPEYQSC